MSISVIVATYGDPDWKKICLERARPSAVSQDALEVIVHYERSESVAAVRNFAAKQAAGDWLCFLDADDELAPGYIKAMEKAIEQRVIPVTDSSWIVDPRVLYTPAVQVVRQGRTPGPPTFFKEVPLRQANWLVVGTLVHRDLFWEVGGFDNHPHGFEDWALWSKCVRAGAEIVKVPDAVYRYWVNPASKHREGWRDKKWQRDTHQRIEAELDAWEAARA